MKPTRVVVLFALLIGFTAPPLTAQNNRREPRSTYDAVVAGTRCFQNVTNVMECHYQVGKSLYIVIAGVGEPDAAIIFQQSSMNGDFYGRFGIHHGCVIVTPGENSKLLPLIDLALISPRTGKVYRGWEQCRDATMK